MTTDVRDTVIEELRTKVIELSGKLDTKAQERLCDSFNFFAEERQRMLACYTVVKKFPNSLNDYVVIIGVQNGYENPGIMYLPSWTEAFHEIKKGTFNGPVVIYRFNFFENKNNFENANDIFEKGNWIISNLPVSESIDDKVDKEKTAILSPAVINLA